jgi:hypothetical protein
VTAGQMFLRKTVTGYEKDLDPEATRNWSLSQPISAMRHLRLNSITRMRVAWASNTLLGAAAAPGTSSALEVIERYRRERRDHIGTPS